MNHTRLAAATVILASLAMFGVTPAFADCKTPMPAVVPIDQAATNPQYSEFLGIWNGNVQGSGGPVVCQRIAVQHVNADGTAKLIFAHGPFSVSRGGSQTPLLVNGDSREIAGRIDDDGLHFTAPNGSVYLIKADGSATVRATSGATGTGHFAKQ
jgi:hypothetical protein